MGRKIRNWQINRIVDRELSRCAGTYARGRLIDIGCATKPYAGFFRNHVSEHIGVDHAESMHSSAMVDLVGTAYSIPVEDESFDTALCSAVLEHLEEPEAALRECFRVLRPGGMALYTVPFIWPLHEEPRDFFRYSRYGLDYLFRKSGFAIIELKPLSGFWITFGQQFVYYLDRFNRGPLRWLHLIDLFSLIIQSFSAVFDRLDRAEGWTWMYLVVAMRPTSAEGGAAPGYETDRGEAITDR